MQHSGPSVRGLAGAGVVFALVLPLSACEKTSTDCNTMSTGIRKRVKACVELRATDKGMLEISAKAMTQYKKESTWRSAWTTREFEIRNLRLTRDGEEVLDKSTEPERDNNVDLTTAIPCPVSGELKATVMIVSNGREIALETDVVDASDFCASANAAARSARTEARELARA